MAPKNTNRSIALEAYEKLAEQYARQIHTKTENALYDRPAIVSLLPSLEGKKVLDAGCGPGTYTEILVSRGAEVTAFDISPRMLEIARSRLQEKAEFEVVPDVKAINSVFEFLVVLSA